MKKRNMKKLKVIIFLLLIINILYIMDAYCQGSQDTIETLSIKINAAAQKETEIEKKVVEKIYDIKETVDNYSKSEKDLKGLNGLGKIEQLELKAQRYGIERQARKIIEKEVFQLIDLLKKWDEVKEEIASDQKLLELKKKILEIETSVNEGAVNVSLNKENIEYYEVKKDATLKEISSLPDVYGNSSSWKFLFDANRDIIKDPTKPIPSGTVLIVPDIKVEQEFKELD